MTFHGALNFGSALQAYALQTCISGMGHDVRIVDYRAKDYEQYRLLSPTHPRALLKTLGNFSAYRRRARGFGAFIHEHLKLTPRSYSWRDERRLDEVADQFDCFVCGSDQIWNLDCTRGAVGPYFLSFAGDRRRVAYAPSLAHTSFRPENFDKALVARYLSAFDFLSVREKETRPLFQALTDKPISVVVDPTLLLDAASFGKIAAPNPAGSDYIFVYLLRSCSELVESAIRISVDTGMPVVYVSEHDLPIPGGVNVFGIGPSEFLAYVRGADRVLTNSFHATVFSLQFHRDFVAFPTDRSAARMTDLLGEVGLGRRASMRAVASVPRDENWAAVDRALVRLRENSLSYLEGALS